MANLSKTITVYSDGSQKVDVITPPLSNDVWYWIPPDQLRGEVEYQDTEYKTRGCTVKTRGCPGVVILGEVDNHHYSRAVKFTKIWQYLSGDLISLSAFGVHFPELGNGYERELVNKAFTHIYTNEIALANGDSGFGAPTPKNNYMTGEDGVEDPTLDAYRRMVTDSVQPSRHTDNPIIQNRHGQWVMAVDSFVFEENPPFTFSDGKFTFNYDKSILDDPRVAWVSQQYLKGVVGPWGWLGIGDVPYPFITRSSQLPYYPMAYVKEYSGNKKELYYSI